MIIWSDEFKVKINNCNLKYFTGEKIAINYKMNTNVRFGNYLVEIPMLVANFAAKINDDCILSVDFFEKINLGGVFEFIFHSQKERIMAKE